MLTEDRRQKWETWLKTQEEMSLDESHDTIALVARSADGTLSGGCSPGASATHPSSAVDSTWMGR